MNQGAFIEQLSARLGLTQAQAKPYLSAHLAILTEQLVAGERITFLGFGVYTVKPRAAREGINPATQEKIQIAASRTVLFKAGKALKAAVNDTKK